MRAAPSLRRRLSGFLALSVIAVLVIGGAGLHLTLVRVAEAFVTTRLQHDRDTVVAALGGGDAGPQLALPLVYRQPYSGHYFQVQSEGQAILRSRSLWDRILAVPGLAPGESWRGRQAGPERQPLLVLAQGVRSGGRDLVVAVAEDMSELRATLTRVYTALAAGGLALVAALLWLQRRVLDTLLRPLTRLRADAARLAQGELAALPGAGVPQEVQPLVDAVNRLLAVLAERLSRSRASLGDLAHALKTPLAALAQLQSEPELRDAPALLARYRRQLDRVRDILETQLRRARLAGGAPGVRTAIAPHVREMLATLQRIYADKAVAVDCRVPEQARFRGDPEDLVELLGVLLDNAFKWARSRVAIRAEAQQGLHLVIEDDGPGVPAEAVAGLTRRGQRLDESRPGSGLGLAIAADIVAQYGGGLRIEPRGRLGGLTVAVELPAAPDAQAPVQSLSSSKR